MFKRSHDFCLKHFMCDIGYYSSLSSAMYTKIAIVFLQLFITTNGEFDLACDPVNPSAQTDVTCVCRRTVGSGIKWFFNGNSISDCFLNSGCLPQPIGHTFSINVSEFAYEMTKSAYDYNDCTQINCTDASNTNVQIMVVPSAIKFDSLNPTPISEPAQSHDNGSISITTGCISGYMDVTCEWYTVYNGKPEKYTYGQSAFDTYENSSCSNCNADVNAKKTCGFNHIEASGNETKNVNFRVVLTHTPTNLTWELNSANVYTVKVRSPVTPGSSSWCLIECYIWLCILLIVLGIILFFIICCVVAHICWKWKSNGEPWPLWTLFGLYRRCKQRSCEPEKDRRSVVGKTEEAQPKQREGGQTEAAQPKRREGGQTKVAQPKKREGGQTEAAQPKRREGGQTKVAQPKQRDDGQTEAAQPSKRKQFADIKATLLVWITDQGNCCIIMKGLLDSELLGEIVKATNEVLSTMEPNEKQNLIKKIQEEEIQKIGHKDQEMELMQKRLEWITQPTSMKREILEGKETDARSKMQELVNNTTFSSFVMQEFAQKEDVFNDLISKLQKNTDKYKEIEQGIENAKQDHTKK